MKLFVILINNLCDLTKPLSSGFGVKDTTWIPLISLSWSIVKSKIEGLNKVVLQNCGHPTIVGHLEGKTYFHLIYFHLGFTLCLWIKKFISILLC